MWQMPTWFLFKFQRNLFWKMRRRSLHGTATFGLLASGKWAKDQTGFISAFIFYSKVQRVFT